MSGTNKNGGYMAVFDEENTIMHAAEKTRLEGYINFDAITPYPVHGMEEAVGVKRSWIPWVTFFAGLAGGTFGLWLTWWTSAVSWPINVGGKPMWSLPAFVPVIFELVILFAALASVKVMIFACGLPRISPPVVDPDLTCSKFGLFVSEKDAKFSEEATKQWLSSLGAKEIHRVAEY